MSDQNEQEQFKKLKEKILRGKPNLEQEQNSFLGVIGEYSLAILIINFAFAGLIQALWKISFVSYLDFEPLTYWNSYGFMNIICLTLLFRRVI